MERQLINSCITVALAILGWITLTLIEVDKKTETIAVKVEANHDMLTPLWEEFIRSRDGNTTESNSETDYKTTSEEEVELETETEDKLQFPSWVLRTSILRE